MSAEESVEVNLRTYATAVEHQRNAAFNEAAMYAAALNDARAENTALRSEIELLKEKPVV